MRIGNKFVCPTRYEDFVTFRTLGGGGSHCAKGRMLDSGGQEEKSIAEQSRTTLLTGGPNPQTMGQPYLDTTKYISKLDRAFLLTL